MTLGSGGLPHSPVPLGTGSRGCGSSRAPLLQPPHPPPPAAGSGRVRGAPQAHRLPPPAGRAGRAESRAGGGAAPAVGAASGLRSPLGPTRGHPGAGRQGNPSCAGAGRSGAAGACGAGSAGSAGPDPGWRSGGSYAEPPPGRLVPAAAAGAGRSRGPSPCTPSWYATRTAASTPRSPGCCSPPATGRGCGGTTPGST